METARSLSLTRPDMGIILMDAPEEEILDPRWLYLAKPIDFSVLVDHMRALKTRIEASRDRAA
jgi:hypothetical protein